MTAFHRSVFLVRHALSLKTALLVNGGAGLPLTEDGIRQAFELGAYLRDRMATQIRDIAVVSAPMVQTSETAEILGRSLGCGVAFEESFRSIGMGIFDGVSDDRAATLDPEAYALLCSWRRGEIHNDQLKVPGIETHDKFSSRVYAGLQRSLARKGGVIIVCSRSVANALFAMLSSSKLCIEPRYRRRRFDPGSVTEFCDAGPAFRQVLYNYTGYLSESRVFRDD